MKPRTVLGVDPGLDGAIAVINPDGRAEIFDIPTVGTNRREYNMQAILAEIVGPLRDRCQLEGHEFVACMEAVHAMPKNGSQASFSLGIASGMYRMLFAALGISLELVPPQRWKSALNLSAKLGKDASRETALGLFPSMADQLKRKKDHGRAEALLIAEWKRRQG